MKKILTHFYNQTNLGDDLFIKILSERYKDIEITIPTSYKSAFSNTREIKKLAPPWQYILIKLFEKLIKQKNLLFLNKAKNYDLFLQIGGSLFMENGKNWSKESDFFNKLPIPYYLLGSNIGPYHSPEFISILKKIFHGAQDVCLRDNASYALVNDLSNVRASTDIAFCLDLSSYTIKNEKKAIFSIIDVSRKFDISTTEKYENEIKTMTQKLTNDGYKVVYMSFCKYEGDEEASTRIYNKLSVNTQKKVERYNYTGDIDTPLSIFASSELIIASRFHATILGLIFNKKVLPMAYSDKTINILKDMEFPGTIVDIRKINEFDSNTTDFTGIPTMDASDQRLYAEKQFQELDKVLKKSKND